MMSPETGVYAWGALDLFLCGNEVRRCQKKTIEKGG